MFAYDFWKDSFMMLGKKVWAFIKTTIWNGAYSMKELKDDIEWKYNDMNFVTRKMYHLREFKAQRY